MGLTALTAGLAAPELLGLDAASAAAPAALGAAGGDLSGLTASDVTFLDPTLLGEASAPGAVAPALADTVGIAGSGETGAAFDPAAFTSASTPVAYDPAVTGAGSGYLGLGGTAPPVGAVDPSLGAAGGGAAGVDPGALPGTYEGNIPTAANPNTAPGVFGAGQGGTQPGFFSSLATNTGKALTNPLTDVGLAAGGYNLYQGYETKKAQQALTAQEQQLANTQAQNAQNIMNQAMPLISSGQVLTSYLTNNTLPPQFQSMVTQWLQGAKASITQGYASRGMSSDPKQNSQLAADLNNAQQQADEMMAQLESTLSTAGNQMIQTANGLVSSGISATTLAAEIPVTVAKLNDTLNTQMASVMANFAAALNGGRQGTTPTNVITPTGGLNFG